MIVFDFKLEKFKGTFFNSDAVKAAVDAATRRVLSKLGAFVRTAAKSSIRKRKRPSKPGKPPSSHQGDLRTFIYFGYDTRKQSVVIGPVERNKVYLNGAGQPLDGTVPEILEYGGKITVLERYSKLFNEWLPVSLRSLRRRDPGDTTPVRRRVATIAARPFMHPALKQEVPKLPAMWLDSVKP